MFAWIAWALAGGDLAEAGGGSATHSGERVLLRTLVAPRGGLPEESLEPLLRTQQDRPLSPYDVRQDIALLYRVGEFQQVEADVEPWVSFDAEGNPIDGVRVEFRAWRSERVLSVEVRGARALSRADILGALDVAAGGAWGDEGAAALERRVVAAYRAEGYPAARAEVAIEPDPEGDVVLRVQVEEGVPNRVAEVRVRGGGSLPEARIRAIVATAGIRRGEVYSDASLRAAQDRVIATLRRAGYYEARVNMKVSPVVGGDRVSVLVDPRRKFRVVVEGRPWPFRDAPGTLPTSRQVVRTLQLEEGVRVGRGFSEAATETLLRELRDEGWPEPEVTVELQEAQGDATILVRGSRGPRHVLRNLVVQGDAQYSARFVRGALREGDPAILGRTWTLAGRPRITPEAIDRALPELEEFYRSQGYLSPTLSRGAYTAGDRGDTRKVDLVVQVDAGPRATLREVRLDGGDASVPLGDRLSSLVGKPLDPALLDVRAREVVALYQERGFLHADARVSIELDDARTSATAILAVDPGPEVYLRGVLVRGYRRTKRWLIEREMDLRPGQVVVPSELADVRRGLYDLGVFRRVSVEPTGDEDRVKDVLVEVDEQPNLHFEVGGGVATDEGARLYLRGGHRNLWGIAHRLLAYGQAGLGWVGDGWEFDTVAPEWRAALRYEAPHTPTPGELIATDVLLNEQTQEASYRLQRSGGAVSIRVQVGPKSTAELSYGVQWRVLDDVDPGVLVAGDPWLEELSVADLHDPAPVLPSASRLYSGVGLGLVLDYRDEVFNPSRGGIGTLSLAAADAILSDVAFVRGEGSWTQHFTALGLGIELRARAGAAYVADEGTALPVEDRFHVGGGGSFRGFDVGVVGPANESGGEDIDYPEALAPVVAYAGRDTAAHWVPTGGDAMAVGTAELHVPFPIFGLDGWEAWQLALFSDVGNAWWVDPGVTTGSQVRGEDPALRWSVGAGIRRSTPIGPVQVDVGVNPVPLEYRGEDLVRVHVSLGSL